MSDYNSIHHQNIPLSKVLQEDIDFKDKVSKNLIEDLLGEISEFKDEDHNNSIQSRSFANIDVGYKD